MCATLRGGRWSHRTDALVNSIDKGVEPRSGKVAFLTDQAGRRHTYNHAREKMRIERQLSFCRPARWLRNEEADGTVCTVGVLRGAIDEQRLSPHAVVSEHDMPMRFRIFL